MTPGNHTTTKPRCKRSGTNDTLFTLIERATQALEQHGQAAHAEVMWQRIKAAQTSHDILAIIADYVEME